MTSGLDFTESDMYKPVKDFFTGLGYSVNAEVKGIDVAMVKDGVLTVVELKKHLNITLLYQAVDRQSVTSQVYVAIPRPRRIRSKENAVMLKILKKLELGLIYVDMGRTSGVEIVRFPTAEVKSPSRKRKNMVMSEISGRSVDVNKGGQTRKPIATAYREKAVKIACVLENCGALSARELVRNHGCSADAYRILTKNYYGWFEKAGKAKFGLSKDGVGMLLDEAAAGEFKDLINSYRREPED